MNKHLDKIEKIGNLNFFYEIVSNIAKIEGVMMIKALRKMSVNLV